MGVWCVQTELVTSSGMSCGISLFISRHSAPVLTGRLATQEYTRQCREQDCKEALLNYEFITAARQLRCCRGHFEGQ